MTLQCWYMLPLGVIIGAVTANALGKLEHHAVEGRDWARLITAREEQICYTVCNKTEARLIAAAGASFKGKIATGLGEIDEPFSLKRCHLPPWSPWLPACSCSLPR